MKGKVLVGDIGVDVSYNEDYFSFVGKGSKLKLISKRTNKCIAKFNLKKESVTGIEQVDANCYSGTTFLIISDFDNYGMRMDIYRYDAVSVPNSGWTYEFFKHDGSFKGISIKKLSNNLYLIHRETEDEIFIPKKPFFDKERNMHHKVYVDSEISECIGSNVILVEDKYVSDHNPDLFDIVTYGIDSNTGDIVTPIYSKKQKEYFCGVDFDTIIRTKILESLNSSINTLDDVYTSDGNVNKKFVKRFKK